MPTVHCKYHHTIPARYECPRCAIALCPQCVKPVPQARHGEVCCPVCNGELDSLGIGNTIVPFWERLPAIFAYPANPTIAIYLAMLSLATLLGFLPILGLLVYLLVFFVILKGGYVVLEETAHGQLTPSQTITSKFDEGNLLPLKQFAILMAIGFANGFVASISPLMGTLLLIAALFAIPASVITLAITNSFVQAINPTKLFAVITAIGWPYLLLYLFLILLSSGSSLANELLLPLMPTWLFLVLSTFIGGYFIFIMFHLMGYVVYQYHEPLGLEEVKEFEAPRPASAPAPEHPLLTEIDILMAEGQPLEAKQRLAAHLQRSNEPPLHERYHKLLLSLGEKSEALEHGRRYIPILLELEQPLKALELFAALSRLDPSFTIADGQQTYRIAQLATDTRRPEVALRALSSFAQRFPGHPQLPAAYLLAAKLFCEHKNDLSQAKKILLSLLGRFPQHPLEPEIRHYLQLVERLEGSGLA